MLNSDRDQSLRVWLGELKDELVGLEQNLKTLKEERAHLEHRIKYLYVIAEQSDDRAKKDLYEQFVKPLKEKREDVRNRLDGFVEEYFERIKALKALTAMLEKEFEI